MASLITSAINKIRGSKSSKGTTAKSMQDSMNKGFANLDLDQKLSKLYQEYRTEDINGRMLLNRSWFRTALYYQGKQQVSWNAQTQSLEYFDSQQGEDWYTENQFRKDVITNVAALCRSEVKPSVAPDSDRPDDVAAARAGESALDVVNDDIDFERGMMLKNLNLCLFGNAFKYQAFVRDKANGTTIIPKYKFEDQTIPGSSVCPACQTTAETNPAVGGTQECPKCSTPMEELAPAQTIPAKVDDGHDVVENGRNIEIVTGPLEMYMRSKVLHGLKYQPYLFWVRRVAADIVAYARPGADVGSGPGIGADQDLSAYYVDVLSTLAGGSYEGVYRSSGTRYYKEVEYAMCWIRPEAFHGDADLKKKYPNGVQFETCNGKFIEGTDAAVSMDDCWTHYTYIVNPYSAWGDGMVDALPVQDQINETNSLLTRYLRNCTVGKMLFDQNNISPEFLSNNPNESWIPTNTQMGQSIGQSVYAINPVPLSQDVPQWKQGLAGAMQDMSGAYNALAGKSNGANTPYSADVFQNEQAMGRFLPTFKYNRASTIQCVRQQLQLFRDNQTEERTRKFKDNTGRWSYENFMGSDLAQGSFDIVIADTEAAPKSKAERAKGLEMFAQLAQLMPALSQKQRVYVLDLIGMPPDANPDTLMSEKAYRDIDAIVTQNEDITPNGFILDVPVYVKTVKEFLAGEEGDTLMKASPEAFQKVFTLMMTVMQMGQMQQQMPPHGPPPGPGGSQGGPPQQGQQQGSSGAPPQGGAPSKPPGLEQAQSPVAPGQQKTMPPLPAGARQG